jgi:hypothetical protein
VNDLEKQVRDHHATARLRENQMGHPELGGLFEALYTLTERIYGEFFWDAPEMPLPFITLEREQRGRLGSYVPWSTSSIANVINLNPFVHATGADLATTLAHEIMHLWENHVGEPTINNLHTERFHERMWTLYGIRTEGEEGVTFNVDERWEDWMRTNDDLRLESYLLPGQGERKPPRRMKRHQCPSCGTSVHARRSLNLVCGDCEETMVIS